MNYKPLIRVAVRVLGMLLVVQSLLTIGTSLFYMLIDWTRAGMSGPVIGLEFGSEAVRCAIGLYFLFWDRWLIDRIACDCDAAEQRAMLNEISSSGGRD